VSGRQLGREWLFKQYAPRRKIDFSPLDIEFPHRGVPVPSERRQRSQCDDEIEWKDLPEQPFFSHFCLF
jgi:hypothetical protein